MRVSSLIGHKIKTRKKFDDLAELLTSSFLVETSFFDNDGYKGLIKLSIEKSVENNLEALLKELMQRSGIQPIELPTLQPYNIFETTDRIEKFGREFVSTTDDRVVFPTSEEPIINYLGRFANLSYRELPMLVYQFKNFFRATTPKALIRLQEFKVLDIYSLNETEDSLRETIKTIIEPMFFQLWERLNLKTIQLKKDENYIDIKVKTAEGNDTIPKTGERCLGIGVIMNLGNNYSKKFGLGVADSSNNLVYPYLGSYAIGIERLIYAMVDQGRTKSKGVNTIKWPEGIEPVTYYVIKIGESNYGEKIYKELISRNKRVLLDDSKDTLGTKFARAYAIGAPYIISAGPKEESRKIVGIEESYTGERWEIEFDKLLCM